MRNEVAELKKHLEKFSAEIGNRTEESYQAGANHGTESKAKSVEFTMSSRHSGNMHPKRKRKRNSSSTQSPMLATGF